MYNQLGHTCKELLNIFIPVEGGLYSRYPVISINISKSRAVSGERDNDPVFFFFPGVDSVLIEWREGPAVHWQQFHKPILALHWITSIILTGFTQRYLWFTVLKGRKRARDNKPHPLIKLAGVAQSLAEFNFCRI